MKYREIVDCIFLDRPNRFIAHVNVNGTVETVHVKNTGRCRELLLPGAAVRLEVSDNPKRKTKYDLVAVRKQELGWVNMDSQAPNKVNGFQSRSLTLSGRSLHMENPALIFTWKRANRNTCWRSKAAHWKWAASVISRMHPPNGA